MGGWWAVAIGIAALALLFRWSRQQTASERVLDSLEREERARQRTASEHTLDNFEREWRHFIPEPDWPRFDIEYVDRFGVVSERRIAVRGRFTRDSVLYIDAYCFEREGRRRFRVDRIERMIDCASGEEVVDIATTARRLRRAWRLNHVHGRR